MIKILHFVSSLNINSGVMSVLMNYYRHVDLEKIQFDFLYFTDNGVANYKEEINSLGGKYYLVSAPNRDPIAFEKDIHRFYQSHRGNYYAVHLHDTFLPAFLLDCRNRLRPKKIIAHAHLTTYGDTKVKWVRNWLLSLPKYLMVDQFWACSHEAGYALAGKTVFEKKGRILNNAILLSSFQFDPLKRAHYRKELGLTDCFVVGHVGHFSAQKNHEFLIRVFRSLLVKKPEAKLVLIGGGALQEKTAQLCKDLNIEDHVLFLGVRDDVNGLLNVFDVFLFPSRYEGLPVSVLEAQAMGIPCIYSDTITKEVNVLKKQNTVLSLTAPVHQWVEAVISANREYLDPHQEMREAGFDIEAEANQIVDYYLES